MSRMVVNVATDSWVLGQDRLIAAMGKLNQRCMWWKNMFPPGCPPHRTQGFLRAPEEECVPYAFKAYAMKEAEKAGHMSIIWCDACIIPIQPLGQLWEYIEREGVWIARNGWDNYQWTAEGAYLDLGVSQETNRQIPHVAATTFGLSLEHRIGRAFLDEYFRLASTTRAFCGPWQNSNSEKVDKRNDGRPSGPCGPPDVLGHRHDQTAASVIAWRLGVPLDDTRRFSYAGGEQPETVLVAKGI